ncbi:MAG: histidine ammonia-lyase [Bacteroidota bacterium]
MIHKITPENITLQDLDLLHRSVSSLEFDPVVLQRTEECRLFTEEKILRGQNSVYGINTGFGSLCKIRIPFEDQTLLQQNLVRSHACGTGNTLSEEVVRLMLILKIYSLAQGHSGIRTVVLQRLADFVNAGVTPVVYEQGSLGASGDLIPLAHLSLPIMGEGEVMFEGKVMPGSNLHDKFGWEPIQLEAKEGLALLNGTQFMQALGVWCILQSHRLYEMFSISAALSVEGWSACPDPFHALIHKVRPHAGQIKSAALMLQLLQGSEILVSEDKNVQDPYSFRCIPQVHGASWDTIQYVTGVFLTEVNSVTDNPLIFPQEELVLSGGNFHGQPLALTLDFLAIAMAEMGSISERRIYRLLSGQRGLPEFLTSGSGLNSGLMIPQYMAASLVSQNRQFCTPASADSMESSNGQEDHVSMGANAAIKMCRIIYNLERILAVEIMTAAQAIEFRRPLRSSEFIESFISSYRQQVPKLENDRLLHHDIEKTLYFIHNFKPGFNPLGHI